MGEGIRVLGWGCSRVCGRVSGSLGGGGRGRTSGFFFLIKKIQVF